MARDEMQVFEKNFEEIFNTKNRSKISYTHGMLHVVVKGIEHVLPSDCVLEMLRSEKQEYEETIAKYLKCSSQVAFDIAAVLLGQ